MSTFGTTPPALLSTLMLGLVLGLRHALDADHLVAISTIVAEAKSWKHSARVGVLWGLGHSAALLGAALILIVAGVRIPPSIGEKLELGVGVMIILLGARLLIRSMRGEVHLHPHGHGPVTHIHPHEHVVETAARHHHAPAGSFVVGLVHGVAGSAALMLLVLATIPSKALALAYVAIFGLGSIGGMLIMSSLLAVPLTYVAHRSRWMQGVIGLASSVFGCFYLAALLPL